MKTVFLKKINEIKLMAKIWQKGNLVLMIKYVIQFLQQH